HGDPDAGGRQPGAELRDVGLGQHGLPPLVRRLGEDLDGGGADRQRPGGRRPDSSEGRHVRAQQVVAARLQFRSPSLNASCEMSGTNRTPPARRSSSPAGVRVMMTSSWALRSPMGITSRPPTTSCATSGGGTPGAAAVTRMPWNGARSGQPRAPSPSRVSMGASRSRSEEHTSELQSRGHLVCRLLLEKKIPLTVHSNYPRATRRTLAGSQGQTRTPRKTPATPTCNHRLQSALLKSPVT